MSARDMDALQRRMSELHNAKALLIAAGYQIASPGDRVVRGGGEWDAETVEACAKVVERYQSFPEPTSRAARYHLTHCAKPNIAAAIRSMEVGK